MSSAKAQAQSSAKRMQLSRDQKALLETVYAMEKLPDAALRERLRTAFGGDGGVHRSHVLHLHFMHDFWVEQKGSHASYLKSLSSPESQALAPSGSGGGICAPAG